MGHTAAQRRGTSPRRRTARPAAAHGHASGSYVHGIVPTGTSPRGHEVTLVHHLQIAALVRPATIRPSGHARREMVTHADLLDTTAATTPVLPLRFGTVLASPEAVERELLAPYHDAFTAALSALAGRAQFTVRARYEQDAIIREVLDSDPSARRLHQQLQQGQGGSDHAGRVTLGEVVARALLARREADAGVLAESLQPFAVLSSVRASQSLEGYRITDAAFIVELDRQAEFENAVEQLARRWRHRARLRLLGPMAAYHFADHLIGTQPEGG